MDVLLIYKVGTLFALIVITFVFGCLPYILLLRYSVNPSPRREKIINILNCFGGGVFLGALLLNLMTEGSEEFEKYKEIVGLNSEYPFYNLFVASGFFLVTVLEYFVHTYLISHDHSGHSYPSVAHRHASREETRRLTSETFANDRSGIGYGSIEVKQATADGSIERDHVHNESGAGINHASTVDSRRSAFLSQRPLSVDKSSETFHGTAATGTCTSSYSHASRASPVRAILLLFALSFHTIFDGLAIGLQETSFQLWEMFIAISVHKSIMAFCLGLELFTKYSHYPRRALIWIAVFSIISPIGISIGISLTSGNVSSAARYLSSGILQGLASGTFMYVTFLEILNTAWHSGHAGRNFLDIFATFIGFTCIAGVKILEGLE